MLDDQDCIPRVHQRLQDLNELVDVGHVEAGGGLVEDIDRPPCGAAAQLRCQLHPLGFAAGEGGGALPQLHVAKSHVHQGLHLVVKPGQVFKKRQRLVGGHLQHVGDGLSLVGHLQGLAVIALAVADLAGDVDVGQKVHLDLHQAVAAARLAPATLDVEGEPPGAVAPRLGLGGGGEEIPDVPEEAGVGGGVGAGRAADGALVDAYHLVQVLQALDAAALARADVGVV